MANPPPSTKKTTKVSPADEECWVLLGQRRGRVWRARRTSYAIGQPHAVEFDAAAVLEREEQRGDVVGFYHTHPVSDACPSQRDVKTMRVWVGSFGKPLLCLIEGADRLAAYRFDHDQCNGKRLMLVERFPRNRIIGVDDA